MKNELPATSLSEALNLLTRQIALLTTSLSEELSVISATLLQSTALHTTAQTFISEMVAMSRQKENSPAPTEPDLSLSDLQDPMSYYGYCSRQIIGSQRNIHNDTQTGPQNRVSNGPLGRSYLVSGSNE